MVNSNQLLDRFGDIEFLEKLWIKAQTELPLQIKHISLLVQSGDGALSKSLHKLRGLISNFLTEEHAISLLKECERLVESNQTEEFTEVWNKFAAALQQEALNLNHWIKEKRLSS